MPKEKNSKDITENIVTIAVIGAGDEVAIKGIETMFSEEKIDTYIEGSVVYSVNVHEKDKMRALKILKKSDVLKDRWHQYIE